MTDRQQKYKHFILEQTATLEPFRPVGGGSSSAVPARNRLQHGNALLRQVFSINSEMEQARDVQRAAGLAEEDIGIRIEFESFPGVELAFESLEMERSNIELLNVRQERDKIFATVFVPDGKLYIFENKIRKYLEEETSKKEPKNRKLIDAISSIRAASVRALWTDAADVFPQSDNENLWWEVWLPVRKDREKVVEQFRKLAEEVGFRLGEGQIEFPERTILLVYGSLEQMKRSILILNNIAELRRAKETADFFDSLPPEEQPEWIDDLKDRLSIPGQGDNVPYVCIIDTGINNGHPLLSPALAGKDLHTVEPAWGVNDNVGHGTKMAGLALLGDLTPLLSSNSPVIASHRLESVKILNANHSNSNNSRHHGYLTIQAVGRPEITTPDRQRVFSMAVTAKDNRDRGRPSAWSATIDRLAVDYENQGNTPRLFVISAGNVDDPNDWMQYPSSNSTDGIHDPGQAWNALTVGAFTELIRITEPGAGAYQPIAPAGGLSPFSTTSQTWQSHWPLKPDVVFEGGNAAKDSLGALPMASLSLLTTNANPNKRLLTTANATSAATALAAQMAAKLMAEYPNLRPETIRGLIVHSAEWTPEMKRQFLSDPDNPAKKEMAQLVRHCGFGKPDLERALWSVENSLTLICEESIQPFKREGTAQPTLCNMNLHQLPWPLEELENLGEATVEMRVTLSYFIEPNPSARGVKSRYRYESHGLRFEVKRPHESDDEFRARINMAARDEEEVSTTASGNDPNWIIGTKNRHRGSIHSDIWRGTAADLASRGMVAVYPVSGWWKTRPKLEKYNKEARYSLIVSIHAPEVEVELYTAIRNLLAVPVRT